MGLALSAVTYWVVLLNSGTTLTAVVMIVISAGVVLAAFTSTICVPCDRFTNKRRIAEFEAFRYTLIKYPERDFDRATIAVKVAEWNEWLAREQFLRQSIFSIWHHPAISAVMPITLKDKGE